MPNELLRWCLATLLMFGMVGSLGCDAQLPACANDSDCFVGEACVNKVCVRQSASNNRNNANNQNNTNNQPSDCRVVEDACGRKVCNTRTGDCLDCEFDMQCGPDGICDEGSGQCFCQEGLHRCGQSCVANDEIAHCGDRCSPCPTAANGQAVCDDSQCDIQCNPGLVRCREGDCAFGQACVECLNDNNCSQELPVCDGGSCTVCSSDADCTRFNNARVCENGACVECVPGENQCGVTSCDPSTNLCTATGIETIGACEECVADEECLEDHACVRMEYRDGLRTESFCLPIKAGNLPCASPYQNLVTRSTVSTAEMVTVCTIAERFVTCEAFQDYFNPCDEDSDCGLETATDGLCKPFAGDRRCTYACEQSRECRSASTCIGNPPTASYCAEID